jgi:hypothetical protein
MLTSAWSQVKEFFRGAPPAPVQVVAASSVTSPAQALAVVPAPATTLEILSRTGDGKTSYLWALLYVLRKLSWVWPQYLCWSEDGETEEEIRRLHAAMELQRLPEPNGGASGRSFNLLLRKMERWGDRPLVVRDDRDAVFGEGAAEAADGRGINWGVPILWLLSLSDLDTPDAQLIDVKLNDLARARLRSARSLEAEPLKLVIAFNKADRLATLPATLRRYLKTDPLAAVIESEREFQASGIEPGNAALRLDEQGMAGYLETLAGVHEEISAWLGSTLGGRLLARRAEGHQLDVRFCVVSATGSGLTTDGQLAIPWSPRRVLDALFWALELESR